MSNAAFFHPDSQSVRLWVTVGDAVVGASIARSVLHYSFSPQAVNEDPLQTYLDHAAQIDDAVRRRVALGSIEPVMLREADLRPAGPAVR
jgi:hypothetical protein